MSRSQNKSRRVPIQRLHVQGLIHAFISTKTDFELPPEDLDNMVSVKPFPKDTTPASPKLYRDISRENPELELLTP